MSEKMSMGVLDEGVARGGMVLDFIGAGVTVASAAGKQSISIPGGAGADIPASLRLPTTDQTIATGYSAYIVGDYEIASGTFLELASNSVLEIG